MYRVHIEDSYCRAVLVRWFYYKLIKKNIAKKYEIFILKECFLETNVDAWLENRLVLSLTSSEQLDCESHWAIRLKIMMNNKNITKIYMIFSPPNPTYVRLALD